MLRGGVGRYYDFAYTNANILFAVHRRAVVVRPDLLRTTTAPASATPTARFFQVGQPLPPNQLTHLTRPAPSQAASPRHQAALHRPGQLRLLQGPRQRLRDRGGRRLRARPGPRASRPASTRRINGGTAPRCRRASCPSVGGVQLPHRHLGGRAATTRASASPSRSAGTASCSSWAATRSPRPSPSASLRATDEFGEYDVARRRSTPSATPGEPDPHRQPPPRHRQRRLVARAGTSPSRRSSATSRPSRSTSSPASTTTATGSNCDLPAGVETLNSGPRRRLQAARPARLEEVPLRRPHRLEIIAEGFNLTNATNPGSYVANQTSANVRAADGVRRRLPARRAAAVPDRRSLRVLGAVDVSAGVLRGRPPFLFLRPIKAGGALTHHRDGCSRTVPTIAMCGYVPPATPLASRRRFAAPPRRSAAPPRST